jgi:hypothetical protein
MILKSIDADYASAVGKPSTDAIERKFTLLIGLLERSKMEIEGLNSQLIQVFDKNAVYILEVGLWVREDCDSAFKQQRVD